MVLWAKMKSQIDQLRWGVVSPSDEKPNLLHRATEMLLIISPTVSHQEIIGLADALNCQENCSVHLEDLSHWWKATG